MSKSLYSETLIKIKSLEIQGAENIAIAGVKAFAEKLAETDDEAKLKTYIAELSSLRVTEPALKNALQYCFLNFKKIRMSRKRLLNILLMQKKKLRKSARKNCKRHDDFYSLPRKHGYKNSYKSLERRKRFTVRNTETRPKFQGRKTAEELAKAGIPVIHGVDSTGRIAFKRMRFIFIRRRRNNIRRKCCK